MAGTPGGAGGAPLGWEVTGQQETTGMNDAGQFVPGVRVSFRLKDGAAGSVFVPEAQYSPDRVAALVAVRAAKMLAVSGLRG